MAEPDKNRRGAMRPIAVELPKLVGKPLGRRGFGEGGLIAEWPAVVGEEIARQSAPLKLSFPRGERRGGTLTLRVIGAFAIELQHLAPQLIERINNYLGYAAVTRLKLEQGRLPRRRKPGLLQPAPLVPKEEAALATTLTGIGDTGLREALDALGRAVKGLHRPSNPAK
ncbi:MAG: hypothetical protein QOK29_1627 [Rhodospirillaceae bacterium]|jgi:hypothetical protein|nr:hypothetical protein [Rhodospirillaceae bacterium]